MGVETAPVRLTCYIKPDTAGRVDSSPTSRLSSLTCARNSTFFMSHVAQGKTEARLLTISVSTQDADGS